MKKHRALGSIASAALLACFLLTGGVAAQDAPPIGTPGMPPPAPFGAGLRLGYSQIAGVRANHAADPAGSPGLGSNYGGPTYTPGQGGAAGVRRITLEEARQMATGAKNPLARIGELQVEAAKQHRLGVQALYFPNVGWQFENLHFNKLPGEVLTVRRPLQGGIVSVPVNIVSKDSTAFNFSVVQPVTPLFAIHQLVKIARADENIAKAKAGMPVAETARRVEEAYFELLIAERELISAEADAQKAQSKWVMVSSGAPGVPTEPGPEMTVAEKAVVLSAGKVKELTVSLDEMLGLPEGTKLELVPPEPLVENLSLKEITDNAAAATPEIVVAEQTAIKAHAGSALAKMEYFPSVAIVGGYTNQNLINVVLPQDFTYIGIIATYTVFDFGKREHGVKERKAQAEAADLAVQLAKDKAAAGAKTAYFELERSRQLSQLARRMVSAAQVINASYHSDGPEVESARANMEADMFRAELEYRQTYARVVSLMGK